MEIVQKENIIISWIMWHYFEMPQFLFKVWKNYIMFATNFFSLPLLLKTLLSPWRRNAWKYPKGLDIQEIFSVFISNVFSRLMGFGLRFILIIVGAIFQVFVALAGIIIILMWLLLPFITIAGIYIFLS